MEKLMSLIHYLLTPLTLVLVLYMHAQFTSVTFISYNGTGGTDIFNFLYFNVL